MQTKTCTKRCIHRHVPTDAYTNVEECITHILVSKSHHIQQSIPSAFRTRRWCEVCSALMCCVVKMQFRCVAFPGSLQRFVFRWRNLNLGLWWGSVLCFHYRNQGKKRKTMHPVLTHGKPNFKPTSALSSNHAVGAKREATDLYYWVAFTLNSSSFKPHGSVVLHSLRNVQGNRCLIFTLW